MPIDLLIEVRARLYKEKRGHIEESSEKTFFPRSYSEVARALANHTERQNDLRVLSQSKRKISESLGKVGPLHETVYQWTRRLQQQAEDIPAERSGHVRLRHGGNPAGHTRRLFNEEQTEAGKCHTGVGTKLAERKVGVNH
jgi:hypothetical protein